MPSGRHTDASRPGSPGSPRGRSAAVVAAPGLPAFADGPAGEQQRDGGVEPDPAQAGRVFFGAWVTLEDEEGEIVRYRIVGPDEADAKAGLISAASPLGRALLGKEEGDTAVVERPRGPAEYTIRAVDYR